MSLLNTALNEIVLFLGLTHWINMINAGDFSSLATFYGLMAALGPLLPAILVYELAAGLVRGSLPARGVRAIAIAHALNRVLATWISFGVTLFMIGILSPFAPFQVQVSWWGLVYGYLAWELAHYVYHYLAHKVRLLWCLHATHHAPEHMGLTVGYARFFLEQPYADFVRVGICVMLGLSTPLLIVVMMLDALWGGFIHVGEHVLKDGRLGRLERVILTPSHHRVHHSRNPLYMDTNFCNLLKVWDWLFGTLQNERRDVPCDYGLARRLDSGSFVDIYFGEIVLLARDVWGAPGLANKLRYLVMPPGWSHTGQRRTASDIRRAARASDAVAVRKIQGERESDDVAIPDIAPEHGRAAA